MPNDKHFFYLIGAIDTRGVFWLYEAKRKGYKRRSSGMRWVSYFTFTTYRKETCLEFLRVFGGNIVSLGRTTKTNWQDYWTWRVMGRELESFCKKVYPHLFILKRECELVMKFRNTYPSVASTLPVESNIISERHEIVKEFREIVPKFIDPVNNQGEKCKNT